MVVELSISVRDKENSSMGESPTDLLQSYSTYVDVPFLSLMHRLVRDHLPRADTWHDFVVLCLRLICLPRHRLCQTFAASAQADSC